MAQETLKFEVNPPSPRTLRNSVQECIGQGLGNIASGLTGGMGGCAMIGQTQAAAGPSRFYSELTVDARAASLCKVCLNQNIGGCWFSGLQYDNAGEAMRDRVSRKMHIATTNAKPHFSSVACRL